MAIGILIGIGVTMFLLVYIMFKIKTDVDANTQNHFLLQLIILFFIIGLFALLGKATLDESINCEWIVDNSTVNNNVTTYETSYTCSEAQNNTGLNFYKAIMWMVRILFLYVFLYIAYEVLKYLGWVVPK